MEARKQLGLARRIYMLLTLLTILLALSGYLGYSQMLRLQLAPLKTRESDKVTQLLSALNQELGDIRNLMRVLRNSTDIQTQLSATQPLDQHQLTRTLARFSHINRLVSQVRWVDASGQERARINVIHESVQSVPPQQLQNKADRYYFRAGMQTSSSAVYISRLDLNVEHHRIVRPFEPTLRATIRTTIDQGMRPGLLIINFNLAPLFRQFRALNDNSSDVQIVNTDGYWRLHPSPDHEWGEQLGHKEMTLARQYPEAWRYIRKHPTDSNNQIINGRLWSYWRFQEPGTRDPDASGTLFLISATRPGLIENIKTRLFWGSTLITLVIYILIATLLLRLLRTDEQRKRLSAHLTQEKQALEVSYRELRQAHSNLQTLQDELVETRKLSSLGIMVAGVAHELNTPTGSALITLSSLERDIERLAKEIESGLTRKALTDYIDQTRKGLALATHSLHRAAGLIKSFKRLAVERSAENLEAFSLGTLVDDLMVSLHHRFKNSRIQIRILIDREIRLHSYPGILSQILQNLIENALAHAFPPEQTGEIRIESSRIGDGNQVEIRVCDDGQGIDPKLIQELFDPFVTSKRSQGHTGLGMHLVHQWVTQLLHGHIAVDSKPGKGCRFTVTMPVDLTAENAVPD